MLAVLKEGLGRVLAEPVVNRDGIAQGKVARGVARREGRERRLIGQIEARVQFVEIVVDVIGGQEGWGVRGALQGVGRRVPAGLEVAEEVWKFIGS